MKYTSKIAAAGGNKIAKIDKRIFPRKSLMMNVYKRRLTERNQRVIISEM
jgi:hypothetical protein